MVERMRLLEGVEHQPGLQVELIDLGANRDKKNGIAPESMCDPQTSPHAGILAAAAEDPEWIHQMDGVNVPYVWIPGYKLGVQNVPYLRFLRQDRTLYLYAELRGLPRRRWAVPEFVK
jgi:hypothetical protein